MVTIKSINSLPHSSSLILFAQSFHLWPLRHHVSKCTIILQPISYYISAKASIFPSLLPTHMSIPLFFTLYIFSFRLPPFRPVNLCLCCSNPHLSLSSFPRSFPLSLLDPSVPFSLTSSNLALSLPSLNPVSA